jgi:hypothetical protein
MSEMGKNGTQDERNTCSICKSFSTWNNQARCAKLRVLLNTPYQSILIAPCHGEKFVLNAKYKRGN